MARSKWLVNSSVSRFHPASKVDFRLSLSLFFSFCTRETHPSPRDSFLPFEHGQNTNFPPSSQPIKIHFANFTLPRFFAALLPRRSKILPPKFANTYVAPEIRFLDVSSTSSSWLFDIVICLCDTDYERVFFFKQDFSLFCLIGIFVCFRKKKSFELNFMDIVPIEKLSHN